MPPFIPRTHFPLPTSLPKTYHLGHHAAALTTIKQKLSTIDLIIECRDYRIPLTSRNPVLEKELGLKLGRANGGKERIVVYTKTDLGADEIGKAEDAERREVLRRLGTGAQNGGMVHFSASSGLRPYLEKRAQRAGHSNSHHTSTAHALLQTLKKYAAANFSLTGHRVLVAGMPNVGKSTLLNALRSAGIPAEKRGAKKVAKTGADPGVTRAVAGGVKIVEGSKISAHELGRAETRDAKPADGGATTTGTTTPPAPNATRADRKAASEQASRIQEATTEPIYLLDTPGIFPPYLTSPLSMLKLSLCGCVKDSLLPPITVADYLLFQLNLHGLEGVYAEYCEPTNDIGVFLEGVGRRTGRLVRGGGVDAEGVAGWFVRRWRQGGLGRFCLEGVGEVLEAERGEREGEGEVQGVSWSQAKKRDREGRRAVARDRRMA